MITYQNSNLHFSKNAVFFLERCSRHSHMHWHDAIEFLYIVSGKLKISLNGESFFAEGGDIIAVNSSIIHSFIPVSETVDYYFLIADDNFFISNNLYSQNTVFEPKINTDEAKRLFGEIIRETEKADEYSNISTLSVLMSLFIYLNRHHLCKKEDSHTAENKKISMIRNTLIYLQRHYREKLTIESIAESLHFSKSYLSHTFKAITHYSLIGYINLLRCQSARSLMLDGMSVAEAAAECGFSEISYFSRVFKKTMGILPSEVHTEIFTLNNHIPMTEITV